MNKKEKQAEEQELSRAVSVLRATLRGIAKRKAARYEYEFLLRVRDMIDKEVAVNDEVREYMAERAGAEVTDELLR